MAKKKVRSVKNKIDPIYIPIEYSEYRKNKIRVLQTQMRIIDCVGHLETLKKLKKEKLELFKELKTITSATEGGFAAIISNLPTISSKIEIKKATITQRINFEREISFTSTSIEKSQKETGLDAELKEIQEKLNSLGAY